MPVVTDVDADFADTSLENRIPQISRSKVELLPETGRAVRDVHLAKFAQVAAPGVDGGCCVVVNPGEILFVHGHNQNDVVPPCKLTHQPSRRSVWDALRQLVPSRLLLGAEVWTVEQLLQADNLRPEVCC